MRKGSKIKMRLPWLPAGLFHFPSSLLLKYGVSFSCVALARPSGIGMEIANFHTHKRPRRGHGNSRRSGNPEPRLCADTVMAANIRRSDDGIAPCAFPQHNFYYTQQGLWIPVSTRMTGWGCRILTAARITADNEKALGLPDAASGHISDAFRAGQATLGPYSQGRCLLGILAAP